MVQVPRDNQRCSDKKKREKKKDREEVERAGKRMAYGTRNVMRCGGQL